MVCILSPEITLDDIQYPEMREVLSNVTYLQWPKKQESGTAGRKEKIHFWNRLYSAIKEASGTYPQISVVRPNENVPIV